MVSANNTDTHSSVDRKQTQANSMDQYGTESVWIALPVPWDIY